MARGLNLLGKREKIIGPGAKIEWDDRKLTLALSKAMNSRLKKAAHVVANIARLEVPEGTITRAAGKFKSWQARDPGSLRESIRVKRSKFKDGGWIVQVGGRDTYYWFFVHYGYYRGNREIHPTWFMSRALRMAKARLRGRI